MNKKEASSILHLEQNFEREELRKAYLTSFIVAFRMKSAAVTIVEMESRDRELRNINQAYSLLQELEARDSTSLLFDFDIKAAADIKESNHISGKGLEEHITALLAERKHLMSIRLLELAIVRYSSSKSALNFDLTTAYRMLGKCLIQCGLINQGISFYNYGLKPYHRAKNLMLIADYRSALHYFGMELKKKETDVPYDEICQIISICYFLVGEYENALNIIEDVLPQFIPKRQIFENECKSRKFATAIMLSMYRLMNLEGRKMENLKIRVKYPMCSKYLQNCFGKISEAFKVIGEFEKMPEKHDAFFDSLKPENPVRERIEEDYDIGELQSCFLNIFGKPLEKSLIYHPK